MVDPADTVEFRLDGRPYIPVYINGEGPFWLLFDTGCTGCRITPEVAATLGLEDAIQDDILALEEFRIGKARWKDLALGVYDETPAKELLGKECDGYLGNGFLWYVRDDFSLSIDYRNQVLCFEPKEKLAPVQDPISVTIENYYTVIPVLVEEEGPYRFLVDTGANTCAVSEGIARKLSLPKGERKPARGVAQDLDAYGARVKSISVGSTSVHDLDVSVVDCSLATSYVNDVVDGYIGTNFLENMVVRFDYSLPAMAFAESEWLGLTHPGRTAQTAHNQ